MTALLGPENHERGPATKRWSTLAKGSRPRRGRCSQTRDAVAELARAWASRPPRRAARPRSGDPGLDRSTALTIPRARRFTPGARAPRAWSNPEQLMTIRLGGRAYDSFVPTPIGERANWTIEEGDQRELSWRNGAHSPAGPQLKCEQAQDLKVGYNGSPTTAVVSPRNGWLALGCLITAVGLADAVSFGNLETAPAIQCA